MADSRLEVVRLVPDDNMGTGGIGGTITNSQGDVLSGVLLRFFAGINFTEGTAVSTTTTNAQGLWTVVGLEAGNYTCIIEVDGQDPVIESVQILSGIEKVDANVIVPTPVSPSVNDFIFPPSTEHSDYGTSEVTWSYMTFEYMAHTGIYNVDPNERIGELTLHADIDTSLRPVYWRESIVFISHTFAGPGVYSVFNDEEFLEAARIDQPAARVIVSGLGPSNSGPLGGLDRMFSRYGGSADATEGSISVSVDTTGRYRFSIRGMQLKRDDVTLGPLQPDSPAVIQFDLNNGYVP